MAFNYTYQYFALQGPQKYTKIGILGLQTYNLATLVLANAGTPFFSFLPNSVFNVT
jgi:hypothetical protein